MCQVRTARQTQTLPEQPIGNLTPTNPAAGVDGLRVHRFPDGTRFDILPFQGQMDLVARSPESFGIDRDAVAEPETVSAIRPLRNSVEMQGKQSRVDLVLFVITAISCRSASAMARSTRSRAAGYRSRRSSSRATYPDSSSEGC